MNERPTHRYKIWQFPEMGRGSGKSRNRRRQSKSKILVALMALYDFDL